jgi:type I restriction enzyme S subunit
LDLSALDAKIELNNRINAELEAMAKTLYDYWFVQFDFPDANGRPYKSSGGKMVYNPALKRDTPERWDDAALIDFIESDKSGDWGKNLLKGTIRKKYSVCVEQI